jgi:enoyl-CoA hydratase/carnithine racemase
MDDGALGEGGQDTGRGTRGLRAWCRSLHHLTAQPALASSKAAAQPTTFMSAQDITDVRGAIAGRRASVLRSAPMSENVNLVREGPAATVTLNRPERRNSLSDAMLSELAAAFTVLRDDATTRVVIVTGAPPVFSAGADAGLRSSMSAEEKRAAFTARKTQFRRLFERANTLLENLEQATIAMINGHAVGGGWGLTLACDFRLAAVDAEFWIPEVDLGVPLGVASTTRFVRLVGPARAKEIIMECRRYSATEAQALGLVHRVVPGAELEKATREYAELLAAKPVRPLAEMKARINTIARTAVPEVNAMTEGFLER